ncbi:hypothetical protein [Planomonospora venezuelensis]|uniref:Putative membrane protein n=1 Tax=Planomonospora venezuelensis TaxID=1999 RepID=A0A841DEU0_PLAVE|nr:hypothetical protein [Planomonospora venezuelensis]MBB5966818.1 putative membrane protein [Planomonospora venezuelensis]GIN01678.1 hypothetical protein Pve01_33360 [Planomonospora venezuelensis]
MSHVIRPAGKPVIRPTGKPASRFTLNTDGRRHPVQNILSVTTLVLGLVALVATFSPASHVIASWAGLLGFAGGLYSQYLSATTPERVLNIVGIVASFVGVAFGIFYGGFVP